MPDELRKELTLEEKELQEVRKQPDYQQITVQEYSDETKYLSEGQRIINVIRCIHQSKSSNKRVDVIRQWKPVKRLFKVVKYENQGSILEIKTELFGV